MNTKVQEILAALRRRFEVLYGERLKQMVLYGSQARGDAEPGSDIDVMVVLAGPVSPCTEIARTIDAVAELSLQNDEVVCCIFVSEEQFGRERSPLLLNVRREGIAVAHRRLRPRKESHSRGSRRADRARARVCGSCGAIAALAPARRLTSHAHRVSAVGT